MNDRLRSIIDEVEALDLRVESLKSVFQIFQNAVECSMKDDIANAFGYCRDSMDDFRAALDDILRGLMLMTETKETTP